MRKVLLFWVELTSEWTRTVQLHLRRFSPLFKAISATGDEAAYVLLIVFLSTVVSTALARQFCMLWACTFYVTNVLKDLLSLPRPRCTEFLDTAHADEPGFPSGHTANATALALFMTLRCESLLGNGDSLASLEVIAGLYVVLIALSRVVLGVHSVIDIVGGFFVGSIVAVNWTLNLETVEEFGRDHQFQLAGMLATLTLLYPNRHSANPAYLDVSVASGVAAGFVLGDTWVDCGLLSLWTDQSIEFDESMGIGALLRFLVSLATAVLVRRFTKALLQRWLPTSLATAVFVRGFATYAAISLACVGAARLVAATFRSKLCTAEL